MRSSYRFLLVPLGLLLTTLLATSYVVRHTLNRIDSQNQVRIATIRTTLQGPPSFRITLPVLEQLRNLTGAEFSSEDRGEILTTHPKLPTSNLAMKAKDHSDDGRGEAVTVDGTGYHGFEIVLAPPHPHAGSVVTVWYPDAIRDTEVANAVRPVLWLGLGGGLLATLLAGYVALRYAQAEQRRVLGQISDGLAHQLRNAAAGAKLALQVAVTEDDIDRESLTVAQRQLERLEQILKQFLSPAQGWQLNRVDVDVRTILDTVATLERPRATHAGVALLWDRPAAAVHRPVDVDAWTHVVLNLVGNAIDAAEPGGTVTLALTSDAVTVSDSGPGPPAGIADRIFEPFVSGKPGGIGIGLQVAQQIAVAHGHRITWHRADGRTVFTLGFR